MPRTPTIRSGAASTRSPVRRALLGKSKGILAMDIILRIGREEQVLRDPLVGGLFENLVVSEAV